MFKTGLESCSKAQELLRSQLDVVPKWNNLSSKRKMTQDRRQLSGREERKGEDGDGEKEGNLSGLKHTRHIQIYKPSGPLDTVRIPTCLEFDLPTLSSFLKQSSL